MRRREKRNDVELSSLGLAREQWEREQERLHGCRYVNGVCAVHGSTSSTTSASAASAAFGAEASGIVCTCRAFGHPHSPKLHDALPGRFPGDTEKQRFADRAATDWRTEEERKGRPEGDPKEAEIAKGKVGGQSR